MMFKRNEGYALSYVLVVLLVLCIIAISVMSAPLRNLQMQQASVARMQDKYAAQGMIEQVVAQLEHADSELDVTTLVGDNGNLSITAGENSTYTIKATTDKCVVTAEIEVTVPTSSDENGASGDSENGENNEGSAESGSEEGNGATEDETQFPGYTVTYKFYDISYNSSQNNAGGGE